MAKRSKIPGGSPLRSRVAAKQAEKEKIKALIKVSR